MLLNALILKSKSHVLVTMILALCGMTAACSSNQMVSDSRLEERLELSRSYDLGRIAAIENTAQSRHMDLIWINPPQARFNLTLNHPIPIRTTRFSSDKPLPVDEQSPGEDE